MAERIQLKRIKGWRMPENTVKVGERMSTKDPRFNFPRVLFSSISNHWATPEGIYSVLNDEFCFTFDPCPLMAEESGLLVEWPGRVFCNPPYSKISEFMRKGLFSLAQGKCELVVFLVPSRTDTKWFHDFALKGEIRFIRGRIKFSGAKHNAPFPSMVVIFRDWQIREVGLFA